MRAFLARARLLCVLTRPAVAVLLGLFALTGLEQGAHATDRWLAVRVAAVVVGYLVASVAWNDLSDEPIDRVNLPGQARRPLAAGLVTRSEMGVVGALGALFALGAAASLGWPVLVVAGAGLVLSACYSLPPVRLADRGALASLLLPGAYVAVPYLSGALAGGSGVSGRELWLLASLYVGFIGRILLKDFRDVRGDALFGKRTFLVRHGRRATCATSAIFWSAGMAGLLVAGPRDSVARILESLALGASLLLLRSLLASSGARRDDSVISTLAILGRSTIALVLVDLAMGHTRWPLASRQSILAAYGAVVAVQACRMLRRGPASTLRVPPAFEEAAQAAAPEPHPRTAPADASAR